MNFDESLSEKWERAAGLRQQDFDDLQREVAGVDVGRIARFLPDDLRNPEAAEKRKAEHQQQMLTRLQMMMRDPEYAALHKETTNKLREAQNSLDDMRQQAQRILDQENEAIARLEARAARDSQGRAVFKDQDGETRYADGALVAEDESAGIVWRGDEPSFEERFAHGERQERASGILADIDAGQAEIGDMQERLDNNGDPASKGDMDTFQSRAEEIRETNRAKLDDLIRQPIAAPPAQMASAFPQALPDIPKF